MKLKWAFISIEPSQNTNYYGSDLLEPLICLTFRREQLRKNFTTTTLFLACLLMASAAWCATSTPSDQTLLVYPITFDQLDSATNSLVTTLIVGGEISRVDRLEIDRLDAAALSKLGDSSSLGVEILLDFSRNFDVDPTAFAKSARIEVTLNGEAVFFGFPAELATTSSQLLQEQRRLIPTRRFQGQPKYPDPCENCGGGGGGCAPYTHDTTTSSLQSETFLFSDCRDMVITGHERMHNYLKQVIRYRKIRETRTSSCAITTTVLNTWYVTDYCWEYNAGICSMASAGLADPLCNF